MRQFLLVFSTLLIATMGCTKVTVSSSVSVIDAEGSADSSTDTASDIASDIAPNGDVVSADVQADAAVDAVTDIQVDAVADQGTCEPDCEGLQCGDDGCGGLCGECQDGEVCTAGACCAPQCEDKACGDDGCGGVCGTCAETDTCEEGVCVSGQTCEPDCVDKYCGDDGCSGSCGECVLLEDLDEDGQDKDEVLRGLYGMGATLGEQAFIDELGAQLAQVGLPGAVSLAQPVTSGTSLDYSEGFLSCPVIALQGEAEPEEQDCDQWVNESSGGVYADVVANLANPANMPLSVTSTGYGKDAEAAYLSGVKTGNEWARARARWDLAAAENPVCDITDGPISASKRKGVIVGAHHFKNVLNAVSDSSSFTFSGEYPTVPAGLALCSFSESLLQVAQELAKAYAPAELPTSGPCGAGFSPPPALAAVYEQAQEAFDAGVLIGIDAEYYVASIAFFEGAKCGLGP